MRGVWLLAAALLLPGGLTGQAPPASKAGTAAEVVGSFRIAGRVVSALDGRGLDNSRVTLAVVRSRATVTAVQSGAGGEFVFEHLAAGKYTLTGDATGYLVGNYDQHETFSTAIVTGVAGLDTEHLLLRLRASAAMSGRVLDEAGEPVRQAQVTLYGENRATGRVVVRPVRSTATDDRGEYTIGLLGEGRYYLGVKATPWYATHPQTREDGGSGSPVLTGVDPNLDVAYPMTFYPDVPDWREASPIELKAGGEARVDVHLAPLRAARLSIRGAAGDMGRAYPQMRMMVFDSLEPVREQMQGAGDVMEIVGLVPGRYVVQQRDPKTGGVARTSTVELGNGTTEMDPAAGAPVGSLNLLVEEQSGAKLPPRTRVFLRGGTLGDVNPQPVNDQGEVLFAAVPAGEYRVAVNSGARGYPVMRVEVKGGPPARTRLTIGSGQTTEAKAVVAAGSLGSVEGVARRDGKGVAGAMIVLVPVDDLDDAQLFRRDQSDLDGTFTLPEVMPGRYIAVAIEDGWRLEWGKAAVLSPYLMKGVAVEVGSSSSQRGLILPEPLVVQAR